MQHKKLWGLLLFLCVLLASATALAEENMTFVDANGMTGYYVNTGSVVRGTETQTVAGSNQPETVATIDAEVAVVRADLNRRFIYAMHFVPSKLTYQILRSEVQAYDTKETLESMGPEKGVQRYTASSMLKEVVDFIEALPRA